ncbi:lipocalin family protein [Photobacterium damselae]|uniref:Outer membrane lipoprotein Blc n=1 Tax=Photobacterium damselae TaxID=38293 RepID=A0ABD6X5E7_PHODM|nr:lipocalin family protein [Photobacterium damselae]OBU46447.1 lipocalin [Photobacterium damselae]PSU17821.1 lipocalin [Photobacterium damselae]
MKICHFLPSSNSTIFIPLLVLWLTGCTSVPQQVSPVTAFELNRYMGTWYEIARLDHSFERGLSNISATYHLKRDGSVEVINRGFDIEDKQWSEAIGNAKMVKDIHTGHFKVSFFGPFYSSYVIFHLEPDYSAALVSGYSNDYFWILSRTPSLPKEKIDHYLQLAKQHGFATDQLIYPSQIQNRKKVNQMAHLYSTR